MGHLRLAAFAAVFAFISQGASAEAYRYVVGSKAGLSSTCKVSSKVEKTYLKLYLPAGFAKGAVDSVRIKIHACVLGEFMTANFSLRMPLREWSETGRGSVTIPTSIMKAKFGVDKTGVLTANVVEQNELSGVKGFVVGKHYPLRSLAIRIPGYGSIDAALQRIQAD